MSDRLLKESDVMRAIDKRVEELSNDPVFVRKRGYIDVLGIKKHILIIPSADRPQGEWIEHEWSEEVEGLLISNYECSKCHSWERRASDYCPNCGTHMKGADDENY